MTDKTKKHRNQEAKSAKANAVRTALRSALFKELVVERDKYSFRDAEHFHEAQLEAIRTDIAAQGINTPLLVFELEDGKLLVLDGHRRYFATQANIEKRIKGFTPDMKVPVHIIAKGASEQAKIARAVSANVLREGLPAAGRIKAACDLFRTGMSKADIAKILTVSETQVKRDIDLGTNKEMMALVKRDFIAASTAANLLAIALEMNRVKDLVTAIRDLGERFLKEIEADIRRREVQKEKPLTPAELLPKSRLKADQIAAWKSALRNKRPLGEPDFGFYAGVFNDTKRKTRVIKISALRTDLDDLNERALAKVARDLVTVLSHVAPALKASTSRKKKSGNESLGVADQLSAQLLAGLKIDGLVQKLATEEVEVPEHETNDEEATSDEEGADTQDQLEAAGAVDDDEEIDDEEIDDEEIDDEEIDDEEIDDEEIDDEEIDDEEIDDEEIDDEEIDEEEIDEEEIDDEEIDDEEIDDEEIDEDD